MKSGNEKAEASEMLQSSETDTLYGEEEPFTTGSRILAVRYDTAIIALVVVLVLMVVSYVLGVTAGLRQGDRLAQSEQTAPAAADIYGQFDKANLDSYTVMAMSYAKVDKKAIAHYKTAKQTLDREFKDVNVYYGEHNIFLTVGTSEEPGDLRGILKSLEGKQLSDGSRLEGCGIRQLRLIRNSL